MGIMTNFGMGLLHTLYQKFVLELLRKIYLKMVYTTFFQKKKFLNTNFCAFSTNF